MAPPLAMLAGSALVGRLGVVVVGVVIGEVVVVTVTVWVTVGAAHAAIIKAGTTIKTIIASHNHRIISSPHLN